MSQQLARGSLVLITGATGAIGPRIVNAIHAAGYSIRTLSLDAPPGGIWPRNVGSVIGNITDQPTVQKAMQGVDAVIHLAALLHIDNPPSAMREKYERINIDGTATVVDAAIRAGVRQVVLFSTIVVYGQANGRILTEDTPPHPDTFYAQTKLAAEKFVLEAVSDDGKKIGTVLRLASVYGSRIKGNYERLTRALASRCFIPVGSGLNRRTLVYDKDVAQAALLTILHPAAAGRLFNVTDGQFHTLKEIIESICLALGRRPPRFSLPAGFSRVSAVIVEGVCRSIGIPPPISLAMIDKYSEDIAVDGSLIQKSLGFEPRYDLLTGWEETVREMRNKRVLLTTI